MLPTRALGPDCTELDFVIWNNVGHVRDCAA